MAAPYPVATEINIGKVSSYLAKAEAGKQLFYNGRAVDATLHKLLVMESEIINYRFQNYSSDLTLLATGWYLYALCGRFISAALRAIGSGTGGIIIDPTTNQPVNLIGVTKMFTVGDATTSPLMSNGSTGFSVSETGILFDTVAFGFANASPLPRTGTVPVGQLTYSIAYTANGITIAFALPATAVNGQQYALTYLRAGAGTAFNGGGGSGGAGLPLQDGHEGEVLFTDGLNAYWRYPAKKLTSANFDQTDGVTCINAEWDHNSLVIVFDDLPKVLEPGVDYTLVSGGGFTVIMPGFDASANSYNLTVFLTGKNANA